MIRSQQVAQVRLSPFQYNPVSSELRYYRRLVVQVRWQSPGDLSRKAALISTDEGRSRNCYKKTC